MTKRSGQLTLELFNPEALEFADFCAEHAPEVLTSLRAWSDGGAFSFIYLFGDSACGKSHLAQAAVSAVASETARAMYVPVRTLLDYGPEVLDGLNEVAALAIDDIDACIGDPAWERQLFSIYNEAQEKGIRLLWTGDRAPALMAFKLPDLCSRLSAGLSYHLRDISDKSKGILLQKRAAQRGFDLSDDVIAFVLKRERRDLRSLMRLLDLIDEASLSGGRAVTVPLVRDCAALLGDQES